MSPILRSRRAVEEHLPLKTHWFHILLSLSTHDLHGYGIMQEVLERTAGKVRLWPATLYGSLRRLLKAGMIEEVPPQRRPADDDARRRYYRLTALGRHVLAAEIDRLETLLAAAQTMRRLSKAGAES